MSAGSNNAILRIVLGAGVAVLIVLSGVLYYLLGGNYQPFGTALLNPRPAYDFSLTDHNGKAVKLSDFRGKAVYLFFGFTRCPDVCPTTLLELKKLVERLDDSQRNRVQVLLVSVDPERDTLANLRGYATAFHPSFLGLRGSLTETAQVASNFGVAYQKTEIKSATEYNVSHTASTFLVDPKGQLRLIYGYGRAAQTDLMLEDLNWILRQ